MQEGILDNLIIKNCDIVIDKKRILFKKNNHLIISIGGDLGLSLIPKLIPLLNGKNSFEKILQSLGEFGKEKVIGVLNMLQNHNIIGRDKDYVGLISSEEYHTFQHQIKFFSVKDELMKYEYHEHLRHAKVTLLVSTNFFLPLIKNFIHSGIGEITVLCKNKKENENCKQLWKGEFNSSSVSFTKVIKKTFGVLSEEKIFENDPNFIVVANENISSHSLSLINSWSIKHRTPWISFSDFYEIETIIGPMIIPNKTACYECFELRRDSNMPLFKEIRLFNKERKQLLHKQKNKRNR